MEQIACQWSFSMSITLHAKLRCTLLCTTRQSQDTWHWVVHSSV